MTRTGLDKIYGKFVWFLLSAAELFSSDGIYAYLHLGEQIFADSGCRYPLRNHIDAFRQFKVWCVSFPRDAAITDDQNDARAEEKNAKRTKLYFPDSRSNATFKQRLWGGFSF